MRIDIRTSLDRALERERISRIQEGRVGRYMAWVSAGGFFTTWLIISGAAYFFSEYFYKGDMPYKEVNWISLALLPIGSIRCWVVGIIIFGAIWFAGRKYYRIVAVYQGIVYGLAAGIITFLLFWFLLSVLGITESKLIPLIIASIAATLALIAGIMGRFLP